MALLKPHDWVDAAGKTLQTDRQTGKEPAGLHHSMKVCWRLQLCLAAVLERGGGRVNAGPA